MAVLPTVWGSFFLTGIWVPFMCLIQGVRVAHITINLSYQNLSLLCKYTVAAIGMIVSDECVYTRRLLSDQFTTKKGKENYWDLLLSAPCFALWFSLDFCNNSEMKIVLSIMISGLSFFLIFFLLKMYSLLTPNPPSQVLKCKVGPRGATQQHCGLFNSVSKRWWVGYSGKMLTGTSIHIASWVETWSRWEQIKIWMMFSKKRRINRRSAHTILDKVSSNFVVCKKENPSWGNLPMTVFS